MPDMAKHQRRPVQKYHDRVAGSYDHSYDDAYWKWHDGLTWDAIKPHLPRDQRAPVLDLGCGTGTWAAKLSKSGYAVTCVDLSARMLDAARRKLAEVQDSRATFLHADVSDLATLPNGHFALAVAMGEPIGCTSSPLQALREIHRVLDSGGVVIATFDNRLNALDFYLQTAGPDELEDFLRTGRTHWLTRDRQEQFEITTYTPSRLRDLFVSAGFRVLDLIGKTVLPMRHHRHLLAESAAGRRWAQIEKSLHRDPAAMGRAAHLQIVATKTASA